MSSEVRDCLSVSRWRTHAKFVERRINGARPRPTWQKRKPTRSVCRRRDTCGEYLVAAFDLSELRRQQMVHNVASLCETKFNPDLQDFFDACKNKVPVLENMINPRANIVDKVCNCICPEHHQVGDLVCYELPRIYESCGICLKPRRAARPAASKERVPQSALFDSVSKGDQQASKNGR